MKKRADALLRASRAAGSGWGDAAAGRKPRWLARGLVVLLTIGLLSGGVWAIQFLTERLTIAEVNRQAQAKLDLYLTFLRSEIRRYDTLVRLLATDRLLYDALSDPAAEKVANANLQLKRFQAMIGASAVFVMDLDGLTLAASNANEAGSFVGRNYAFRSYFREAAKGLLSHHVAVGVTSHLPGFYTAQPIFTEEGIAGVAVIKFPLQELVPKLDGVQERFMIADPNGVIFLASERRFLYQTLTPLKPGVRSRLHADRTYGDRALESLPVIERRALTGGSLVTLPSGVGAEGEAGPGGAYADYFLIERPLAELGWTVAVMARADWIEQRKSLSAIIGALAAAGLVLLTLYLVDRRRYLRQLYENAVRDPLTGLYTRLYMNDAAAKLLEQHNRQLVRGVALAVFDLDHFKRINDTHGHHVGDKVLAKAAEVIRTEGRESDVPIRLGGEELAVFIVAGGLDQAVAMAERIRQRIEGLRFEGVSAGPLVTTSSGVVMHRHGEGLSDLIHRADALLYEAKRAGRNRVVAEAPEAAAVPQAAAQS